MVEKNMTIVFVILALVLLTVATYTFITQEREIQNIKDNESTLQNQNGKIGVEIVAPEVEDKGNGK